MSNIYGEYAQLEAQIAALESKKEQLRPFIIQMMIDNEENRIETALGNFSLSKRKVWAYPNEVNDKNEEYKAAKARAESTGEATFEEVDQLRFTMAKL